MLVDLNINEEGIKKSYETYKDSCEFTKKEIPTYEEYSDRFKPLECPGFYGAVEWGFPKRQLRNYYKDFTVVYRTAEQIDEDLYEVEDYMGESMGMADNIDQIKEHIKPLVDSPDIKIVVFLQYIKYRPELKGKGDGFMPRKNGEYIGDHKNIFYCETSYNDLEFDEDYQGYLICYQIVNVK